MSSIFGHKLTTIYQDGAYRIANQAGWGALTLAFVLGAGLSAGAMTIWSSSPQATATTQVADAKKPVRVIAPHVVAPPAHAAKAAGTSSVPAAPPKAAASSASEPKAEAVASVAKPADTPTPTPTAAPAQSVSAPTQEPVLMSAAVKVDDVPLPTPRPATVAANADDLASAQSERRAASRREARELRREQREQRRLAREERRLRAQDRAWREREHYRRAMAYDEAGRRIFLDLFDFD